MPPTKRQSIRTKSFHFANNDPTFTHRERVAIADINAGYTLLEAVPYYKYRITRIILIAIGGNAGGATDVRLLATQAAASAALIITTVGALTRSTVNGPGVANNTVLVDGASFDANDVNTAITVGKTGGALTTCTHVDFIIDYQLIPTRTGA